MTAGRWSPSREDLPALALLLLLPLAFLGPPLLSGHEVVGYSPSGEIVDIRNQFWYTRLYGFRELAHLRVPLWNPYSFGGAPFVATFQSSVFYPFNLVFTVLPAAVAINWSIACHLFLSGAFTYALLRHLGAGRAAGVLAGAVYTLSAPQVMNLCAGNLSALCAMVWTPLLFVLLDRLLEGDGARRVAWLALAVACQFLAGQPQYSFYSLLALAARLAVLSLPALRARQPRREALQRALAAGAAVSLGLGLSAVQLLVSAEMTPLSTRANLTFAWVSMFSLPPANLVTLLVPDFFGDMLRVQHWGRNLLFTMSAYCGIATLVLAGAALARWRSRDVRFFAGLAAAAAVLALGRHTFLLRLLYEFVPGFDLFRGVSRFLFLLALAVAVLAGFGADRLLREGPASPRRARSALAAAALAVLAAAAVAHARLDAAWFRGAVDAALSSGEFLSDPGPPALAGFELQALGSFRRGLLRATALALAALLLLAAWTAGAARRRPAVLLLGVLAAGDLFAFGARYVLTFDSRETAWDPGVLAFLRADPEPFRVIAPYQDLNAGLEPGIETLSGYDTIMVTRYSEYVNVSQGAPPDVPNHWLHIQQANVLTDLLNARYLVLPAGVAGEVPGHGTVYDSGRTRVLRNRRAAPRAYLVHAVTVAPGRDRVFRELLAPGFDPASRAVVEEEPPVELDAPSARSPLPRFLERSARRVVLEAAPVQTALLVLADVWFPGWRAFVDGAEVPVLRTNYVTRGVVLPPGRHRVEFRYEPRSYTLGAALSLASLALTAGLLLPRRPRA